MIPPTTLRVPPSTTHTKTGTRHKAGRGPRPPRHLWGVDSPHSHREPCAARVGTTVAGGSLQPLDATGSLSRTTALKKRTLLSERRLHGSRLSGSTNPVLKTHNCCPKKAGRMTRRHLVSCLFHHPRGKTDRYTRPANPHRLFLGPHQAGGPTGQTHLRPRYPDSKVRPRNLRCIAVHKGLPGRDQRERLRLGHSRRAVRAGSRHRQRR